MGRIIEVEECDLPTEAQSERAVRKLYQAASPITEAIPDFASVTGICRECSNAFMYQRQYGDEVVLICEARHPQCAVPPDVVKCSRFEKRGQLSLDRMQDMATLVDKREGGGQYL